MSKNFEIHFDLVRGVQAGDQEAAEELYNLYAQAMYNTLIRLVGDKMEAQDLLQDAFVSAFQNIGSFRQDATFGAWLKKIVVNHGLGFLRKRKVDFQELGEEIPEKVEDTPIELDVKTISEAILKLPAGSRTVVNLYLIEGYTHDEISEILGISKSTSKTQYMRGKELLRSTLKHSYYG